MASYDKDSFTDSITLKDFAENRGKSPKDFILETIVVREVDHEDAVKSYDKIAKSYDAVLGVNEGLSNIPFILVGTQIGGVWYVIRGVGIKEKK